jgi:hypothetical protein
MRSLAATRTRAMIVLTDGFENTPPMIADVTASLNRPRPRHRLRPLTRLTSEAKRSCWPCKTSKVLRMPTLFSSTRQLLDFTAAWKEIILARAAYGGNNQREQGNWQTEG